MNSIVKNMVLLVCGVFATTNIHAQQQVKQFTIASDIPGLTEGALAYVLPAHTSDTLAVGKVSQGTFVLRGHVAAPVLAELHINAMTYPLPKDEIMKDRIVMLYLDNDSYQVSAAQFDSIPLSYELGSSPIIRENNYQVKGGVAQQQYQRWHNALWPMRQKAALTTLDAWRYKFGGPDHGGPQKPDPQKALRLEAIADSTMKVYEQQNDSYAWAHPDEPYSLYLWSQHLNDKFRYTAAELDTMTLHFRGNKDAKGYKAFLKGIATARRYAKGLHYQDITLNTADGKSVSLSKLVNSGGYTLLDFWASWCGPCRASIPKLKKLHAERPALKIISVSCDKNLADWKEAMQEEKMPWTQVILSQNAKLKEQAVNAYHIQFIPSLVLIAPDGTITYAASKVQEIISQIKAE